MRWKQRTQEADAELAHALEAMLRYITKHRLPARIYSELMPVFGFDHRRSQDRTAFGAALG